MKKFYIFNLIFALVLLGGNLSFSRFVQGRLVALQEGKGAAPLTNVANSGFLKESNTPGMEEISESVIVNLSISSPTASEVSPAAITVTATASSPVVGNQTVSLGVAGTVSVGDYSVSNSTITILDGQTTGTVTLTAIDDILSEGSETATLTISSPSAGLILGGNITLDITIADNDCEQQLVLKSTAISANGAEISAFDPINDKIYTVAGPAVEYYTLDANGAISAGTNVPFGFTSAGNNILPNSVAIKNGIVAVSYAIQNSVTLAQAPGIVAFYNANDGSFINQVTVGYLPDMLTFTPDGTKVLTANEGEPNSYNQATSFDPEGSVSIIDVSGGFVTPPVVTAGFTSFNPQIATLKAAGVRIYSPSADLADPNGPNATVAEDLEPEYITFNVDATKAIITLQEANAFAELDIATATITQIIPLGLKDHSLVGNGLDASDRDVNFPATGATGKINIQNWPVKGMYQPDAIASFSVAGNNYYITANEGDTRAYTGFSEEIRVGAAGYVLDPTVFPTAASTLKPNQFLGRLQLSNGTGDNDGDGDFDEIHANGTRSFTIWNNSFIKVFDSGDQLEQLSASFSASSFNSDGLDATFDTRSDNKGPEPEAVTTGIVNGILYAFVGSERTGDIFVYDISNPMAPVFKQYINNAVDLAVEGLIFVSSEDSPTGKALVISSAELSKTVSVFEFSVPNCTQNIISGIVTEDTDGGIIDGNPLSISGAYISLFKSANNTAIPDLVAEVASGTGIYTFPAVASDTYTLVIGISPDGFNIASYPNVGGFSMGASAEGVAGTLGDGNANGKTKVIVSGNSTIYGSAKVAAPAGVGFASAKNAPLPIKLVSFEGKYIDAGNELIWKTSSEVNLSHFEIQRSNDAKIFQKIGEVSGSGNTVEKQNYLFLDNEAKSIPNAYYRLKSIDFDGKIDFSKIIFINRETEKSIVGNIYPNPATGSEAFLNIYAIDNEQFKINIYDFTGKIISAQELILSQGENRVKLNTGEGIGLLIIKVENKSNSYFRKLVK
ncbi:MAG: choice-of-anchor I family protein [Bacteroidota bacterium]